MLKTSNLSVIAWSPKISNHLKIKLLDLLRHRFFTPYVKPNPFRKTNNFVNASHLLKNKNQLIRINNIVTIN